MKLSLLTALIFLILFNSVLATPIESNSNNSNESTELLEAPEPTFIQVVSQYVAKSAVHPLTASLASLSLCFYDISRMKSSWICEYPIASKTVVSLMVALSTIPVMSLWQWEGRWRRSQRPGLVPRMGFRRSLKHWLQTASSLLLQRSFWSAVIFSVILSCWYQMKLPVDAPTQIHSTALELWQSTPKQILFLGRSLVETVLERVQIDILSLTELDWNEILSTCTPKQIWEWFIQSYCQRQQWQQGQELLWTGVISLWFHVFISLFMAILPTLLPTTTWHYLNMMPQ